MDTLTTLQPQVDPRIRMKEIRNEVSLYLKGGTNPWGINNLGELPENMDDARRVIIAIQDLFEKEKSKHDKATLLICRLNNTLNYTNEVVDEMMVMVEERNARIIKNRDDVLKQEHQIHSLMKRSDQYLKERDAVLTTMKLLNNQ